MRRRRARKNAASDWVLPIVGLAVVGGVAYYMMTKKSKEQEEAKTEEKAASAQPTPPAVAAKTEQQAPPPPEPRVELKLSPETGQKITSMSYTPGITDVVSADAVQRMVAPPATPLPLPLPTLDTTKLAALTRIISPTESIISSAKTAMTAFAPTTSTFTEPVASALSTPSSLRLPSMYSA